MANRILNLAPWLIALSILFFPLEGLTQSSNSPLKRPTLRSGSQENAVIELQAMLTLLGYYEGKIDGIYSDQTENAVVEFQQAAGLTRDGIVGTSTWERLLPLPPSVTPPASPTVSRPPTPPSQDSAPDLPSTLRPGMEGDEVRQLQQELRRLGFYSGSIDGVFGDVTFEAVKAVQERFNLTPDGIVGPSTWQVILNQD